LHLDSGIFAVVNVLGEHATAVGYSVIGLMIASWLVSILVYKASGFDSAEQHAAEPE
jgi:high-affinity nickel permease